MSFVNGAKVVFRKIGGRIIPIYQKNKTAFNIAAATGTLLAAHTAAEKSRNFIASKIHYKGRKGFNSGFANHVFDLGVTAAITYNVAKRVKPVAHGLNSIKDFISKVPIL